MPQIAQHSAAELWEVCRDHLVGATTIRMMAQSVADPQLRSTLERHAQAYERAGHRLEQFLHEPGSGGAGAYPNAGGAYGSTPGFGQQPQGGWAHPAGGYAGAGVTMFDVVAATACLDKCKSMALKCIIGATEASQPARSYLHQLAGEHLQMAEEHYHWLERHGAYASPHADHAAISEYTQKLRQFAQAGHQLAQQVAAGQIPQAVAHGGPTAVGVAPEYTQGGWNVSPTGTPYTTPSSAHHAVGTHQPVYGSTHEIEPRGYAHTQHTAQYSAQHGGHSAYGPGPAYGTGATYGSTYSQEQRSESR